MEVAIIILGAFVLLLFIVAVLLGNKYLKVKNRLKEVETDLEEYTNAAKEDAKTICALRKEIESLKQRLQ